MDKLHLLVQAKKDTSDSLTEKFGALFPSWTTMLATVLAVLILLFILTKLVYTPVKKSFKNRQNYIQKNINQSEKLNSEAAKDREKANEEFIRARIEAAEIIGQAKLKAEIKRQKIITASKQEARLIKLSAKENLEQEKIKFAKESEEAIINVALAAAQKVVEKEVDSKTNRKIISDFIKANK